MSVTDKILYLVIVFLLTACSPLKTRDAENIYLNFHDEGFLRDDIFQVKCESEKEETRDSLLSDCRAKLKYGLAEYRLLYEFDKQYGYRFKTKADYIHPVWNMEHEKWASLSKKFEQFLPGSIVYEERQSNRVLAVYRLTKENLVQQIQKTDPEIQLKIFKPSERFVSSK